MFDNEITSRFALFDYIRWIKIWGSPDEMNKLCHYHQIDEDNYQRCCDVSCDISRDRIKKYQLLRTKETKVMEKYENAMKIHDSIAKRRQSVDIGRHADPLKSTKNMDKIRRFSVPSKPKSKKSLSLQPTFFSRLETLTDDELDSIEVQRKVSTNHMKEKYRLHFNDNHYLSVDYPTNDYNKLSPSSLRKLSISPNHFRKISSSSVNLRKTSVTPTPRTDRSPVFMKKLSQSMDNLLSEDQSELIDQKARTLPGRRTRLSYSPAKTSRYLEISKSLPLASHYRKNRVLPYHQRFLEAKRKFDERKSLLTSLDMDIHKVTLILRKMKSRSLPNLLDTENMGNKKKGLKRSSTLDDIL